MIMNLMDVLIGQKKNKGVKRRHALKLWNKTLLQIKHEGYINNKAEDKKEGERESIKRQRSH